MNKLFKSIVAASVGVAMAIGAGVGFGNEAKAVYADTTYEQLTSIASIDESARYVLGIDGTGFHYEGTSSWGKTALPSAQAPIYYTLKKSSGGDSFTAQATIGGTDYYLQVPTSNTFGMVTSAGTNTDLIIGTTQFAETNYAVANKSTTTRHLRINGTSGLRSYAGSTGTMAFFYKVVSSGPTIVSLTTDPDNNETVDVDSNGNESAVASVLYEINYSDSSKGYNVLTTINPAATANVEDDGAGELAITFTANGTYVLTIAADENNKSTITFAVTGIPVVEYELYTDSIKAGDYVFMSAGEYTYVAGDTISSNRLANGSSAPAVSNGAITNPNSAYVWHIAKSGNYWTIQNAANSKYLAGTSTKNQAALLDDASSNLALWSISYSSGWVFHNLGRSEANSDSGNAYLRNNGTNGWACYTSSYGTAPALFKLPSNEPAISVEVTGETSLGVGETALLTASKLNGATGTIAWATSNNKVLDISAATGDSITVEAVGAGTAKITASLTGCEDYEISFVVTNGTASSPYSVAEARAAIDAGTGLTDVYATGIISYIKGYYNNKYITYHISDDGTETNYLEVYNGLAKNGAAFSGKDDLELGATVIVRGNLKKYNSTYEFDKDNILIDYTAPENPVIRNLESISLSGYYQTSFYAGDAFSHDGMTVTANYDDGFTNVVTNKAVFSGYDMNTPGNQTVVVTYTEDETPFTAEYNIVVKNAVSKFSWDLTIDETYSASDDQLVWQNSYAKVTADKADATTNTNNYYPGTPDQSYTSTRFYKNSTLTIEPLEGYIIKRVVFLATTADYASALRTSSWSNASAYSYGKTVVITPTNGLVEFVATIGGTTGHSSITVYYDRSPANYLGSATSIATIRGTEAVQNGKTVVTSLDLRFGIKIPKSDWDAIEGIQDYGVMMFLATAAKISTAPSVQERYDEDPTLVSIGHRDSSAAPDEDGQGNYNFTVKVNVPDASWYDYYFCVRPFVKINNEIVWLLNEDLQESVRTMAGGNNNGTNFTPEALQYLQTATMED